MNLLTTSLRFTRRSVTVLLVLLLVGCTQRVATPQRDGQTQPPQTERTVSVLAWNVESAGNDPEVIAGQLAEMSGYDIYCLSEVSPRNLDKYADALPPGFQSVHSETGRSDRLQIAFDASQFELLQQNELHEYRGHDLNNGTHRSPLFVRMKDKDTGVGFIVMTNHLARTNVDLRRQQAIGLREWARDQNFGVINIGDFNMDYDFHDQQGNEAFVEMLRDNVWLWVKPEELIDTNWADSDGDGMDNYPDSMLDFAFVAGPAKDWNPKSRVIVREGDFPDDESTSDHRPIELTFTLPGGGER